MMEQMVFERSGLIGLVVLMIVPAIAVWLKSKTNQEALHGLSEDRRESDLQTAYVAANQLRDSQMDTSIKELTVNMRLVLEVMNRILEQLSTIQRSSS